MLQEVFSSEQDYKRNPSLSQTYERYTLVSPEDAREANADGEGESEFSSDDSEAEELRALKKKKTLTAQYGGAEVKLYTDKSLFQEVDKLLGIQNQRYADLAVSRATDLSLEARQDCEEFAVVAFWDLLPTDVFQCSRFFIIPNPKVRIIRDVRGTLVYQVLYVSPHTKDIFFFWKGQPAQAANDDLDDLVEPKKSELQMGFVELEFTYEELSRLGEIRSVFSHCKEMVTIEPESILAV